MMSQLQILPAPRSYVYTVTMPKLLLTRHAACRNEWTACGYVMTALATRALILCIFRPNLANRVFTGLVHKEKGVTDLICNPLVLMAPRRGLEPRTWWLTATRSTD